MKRRDEVLVGIVLSVSLAVVVLGTIWLARGGLSGGYPLYAQFKWGNGLKSGQPVLLSGVRVGYVSDVNLDVPHGSIVVTMKIDNDYEDNVPEGTRAQIQANGLFGDMQIGLIPPTNMTPQMTFFQPGDTVPAAPPTVDMNTILARADSVSRSLSDVAQSVQVELVQGGGVSDLRKTLAGTNKLVAQLSDIAAEQSRQLTLTMGTLRKSVSAVDSAQVAATVTNLQTTTSNMSQLTNDLKGTTAQIDLLLTKLNSDSGTAGKLLNDPQLYNDLHHLVARLDSLTVDFQSHPRKYINLKIF